MASAVFKKLNHKGQSVVVVDAPDSFEAELADLEGVAVSRSFADAEDPTFALGFGTTLADVERFASAAAEHTTGDPVVWFAYPKRSSKRYVCEFDRDRGWAAFGDAGFEPVRQIAIDADWSALRFRRVEHVKNLTRAASGALTEEARRRTTGQGR